MQAHNHNPMEFVRQNEKPSVVEALRRLDGDVSPSVFDTCAVRGNASFSFQVTSLSVALILSVHAPPAHFSCSTMLVPYLAGYRYTFFSLAVLFLSDSLRSNSRLAFSPPSSPSVPPPILFASACAIFFVSRPPFRLTRPSPFMSAVPPFFHGRSSTRALPTPSPRCACTAWQLRFLLKPKQEFKDRYCGERSGVLVGLLVASGPRLQREERSEKTARQL